MLIPASGPLGRLCLIFGDPSPADIANALGSGKPGKPTAWQAQPGNSGRLEGLGRSARNLPERFSKLKVMWTESGLMRECIIGGRIGNAGKARERGVVPLFVPLGWIKINRHKVARIGAALRLCCRGMAPSRFTGGSFLARCLQANAPMNSGAASLPPFILTTNAPFSATVTAQHHGPYRGRARWKTSFEPRRFATLLRMRSDARLMA
jgi:hypothetical protein